MRVEDMERAAKDLSEMAESESWTTEAGDFNRIAYETKMLRATLYSLAAEVCRRLEQIHWGQHA